MSRQTLSKGHVLLVDDNVNELQAVQRYLSREGYTVTSVRSAAGAIGFLKDEEIDLVITDYNMPIRNGMDLFREVRATYPELPVIMMTGLGTEKLAADFIRERGSDYLVKPVNMQELTAKVKRGIGVSCERKLILANQALESVRGSLNLSLATLRTIHSVAEHITGQGNQERVREILYLVKQSSRELAAAVQLAQSQDDSEETPNNPPLNHSAA
ncbi:response regulator [Magnetococcus sp. PR-3]|uniref:response regulator n=1 Tax=Magnetococcus sp. PR-3 TaxID=3120355 RepID=UPI002FCE5DCD